MRRLFILVLALVLAPVAMQAADDVSNTAHNLADGTGSYDSDGTTEVCVFCHTPHGATPAVPLWNHTLSTHGAYTPYSSTTIEMGPMTPSSTGGITALCMSCHDGTVAVGSVLKNGSVGTPNSGNAANAIASGETFYVGTDLSNDHPVSFAYDTTAATGDTSFHDAADATTNGARFYAGTTVECGSCHNPHEDTISYFLRVSNDQSLLCLACHIK